MDDRIRLVDAITGQDFDLQAYINERIIEHLYPAMRRDEARILYGTRAVKQGASKHTLSRRTKRRARKRA